MTSTAVAATVVVGGGYELAEGGRWADGRYVYVDILSGRLFELRDGTEPLNSSAWTFRWGLSHR
ncbi:hypothetical protein [Streptomyces swartbergensis]|uniref:hypothetical protein n=1 Tax=Streptomyces swartbergensis TaxID=487165 RepID=UPI0038124721